MTKPKKSTRDDKAQEGEFSAEEAQFRRAVKEMTKDEFASPTPLWYRVIMFGLVILGILWIMVFYITQNQYPVPSLSNWNIVIGVGLMMAGMVMMTRWR